jgi:hypothetical protein
LSIMIDFLFCVNPLVSPLSVISFQFPMRCAVCAYDYVNVEHISGLFFDCPSKIREVTWLYTTWL